MQAVDRLHGGRRIEERRVRERPLGDVDEHAEAVGDVLVERPLEPQDDVVGDVLGEAGRRSPSVHAQERRPGRHELAERGHELERAVRVARALDELIEVDVADDARHRRGDHGALVRRRLGVGRLGIEGVELRARVLADELDQRRHAQRAADVVHVQDEHRDRDQHEQERDHDGEARDRRRSSPPPPTRTSRIASMACANVATKMPIANWLGLSRRIRCTMRGENCPIASWTTTIVIVRTSAARLTIDVATAERITSAASGPPVNVCGISPWSKRSSIQSVANESTTPASTQATGTNQRLERM